MPPHLHRTTRQTASGFSLVELLIALLLGLVLSGTMINVLLADTISSQRVGRLLRERAHQRRSLDLVRLDVEQAEAVSVSPPAAGTPDCPAQAHRQPLLALRLNDQRWIVYTVGSPPSGIWRGQVLMRCGPAYGLQGQLNGGGAFQNRVVIDGLASSPTPWQGCAALLPGATDTTPAAPGSGGFAVCLDPATEQLAMRLHQSFGTGSTQTISHETTAAPQ